MSKLEKVLHGLEIFRRYEQLDISSYNDCIFAGGEVSDDDKKLLLNLGWIWHDEFECWMIFV